MAYCRMERKGSEGLEHCMQNWVGDSGYSSDNWNANKYVDSKSQALEVLVQSKDTDIGLQAMSVIHWQEIVYRS